MIFKPRFFLDLSGDKEPKQAKPSVVAPPQPDVVKEKGAAKSAKGKQGDSTAAISSPAPATDPGSAVEPAISEIPPAAPTLTTAEAIAVELAAAQANRPAPSLATFAPTCLTPGGTNPPRRRYAGANLGRFKDMAKGMTGS